MHGGTNFPPKILKFWGSFQKNLKKKEKKKWGYFGFPSVILILELGSFWDTKIKYFVCYILQPLYYFHYVYAHERVFVLMHICMYDCMHVSGSSVTDIPWFFGEQKEMLWVFWLQVPHTVYMHELDSNVWSTFGNFPYW